MGDTTLFDLMSRYSSFFNVRLSIRFLELRFHDCCHSFFQLCFAEVVEEGIIGGVGATTEEVIAADGVTGNTNHITKPPINRHHNYL